MKTIKKIFFVIILSTTTATFSQVGINTTSPNQSSELDITSAGNNKGVLIPRMTVAQRDAILSPATGLLIYNTTTSFFSYYNGTAWVDIAIGSGVNIYNQNGTLTSSRTVTQNNNNLSFVTGTGRVILDGNFEQKGAVYAKVRTVTSLPIVWQADDYAVIIQVSGSQNINLPDPTLNAGRMLFIRNNSIEAGTGGTYTYTPYVPGTNSTLLNNRAQTLISNGVKWYVISGV